MSVDDRETPDLFRLAAAQTSVGMALVDLSGGITEINPAACVLFGRTERELLALRFQDITHPDDLAADVGLFEDVVAERIPSYRIRKRYLRPDGSIVHGDLSVTGVFAHGDLVACAALVVDITEQVEAHARVDAAQRELRAVVDTLLDPWVRLVAVHDGAGRIVDFSYADGNDAACRANGVGYHELLRTSMLALFPSHRELGLLQRYADVVTTGVPLELDDFPFPDDRADGAIRYFDNRAVKVGDGLSFTWRDVTDRVLQRERLARQARHDPLTGLANRTRLIERINEAFEHQRRQGAEVAVLYCDMDGLKAVNDTLGHPAGDIVLRAVADRMAGAVRAGDLVARVGGDEFVIVATGVTGEDAALLLALKVADAVARPLLVNDDELVPRVSIGVAVAREGQDADEVLDAADRALYRQKHRRDT